MQFTTAAEAAKLIRSHSSVYIQGSTSIPEVLVQAMTDRADELTDVKIYSGFAVGRADAPYCRPEYKDTFLVNSLFVANNIRRWLAAGYGQSIPAFLGEIPGLFRDGTLPVDVAILNLSRPNEEGYCSFGVSADLAVSAVECAKTVIAQVNTAMPFSYGDAVIHLSRVAAAVEVDDPLVEVPSATPSEIESRIGGYIAELIPDGATLQIGVGGIPNAVLAALTGHKHLGLHTEAMTDGVLPLLESGVIDNSLKKVMPGTTVASLALGSRRLYDYMDYRKDLVMKDVAWTNDPFRIRENPRVMAINSAVEVDLTGQVSAPHYLMRGRPARLHVRRSALGRRQNLHRHPLDHPEGRIEDQSAADPRRGRRHDSPHGPARGHRIRRGAPEGPQPRRARPCADLRRPPLGARRAGKSRLRTLRLHVPAD